MYPKETFKKDFYEFSAGDVLRPKTNAYAFSDCVIIGFTEEGYASLARPYLYASSVGTTGPISLQGVELIDMVPFESLHLYFDRLQRDRVV